MFLCIMIMISINFCLILLDSAKANEYEELNINNKKIQTKEEQAILIANESAIWSIEIPTINLIAEIGEGTTDETMNKYVGHFENTELWQGNVGLAAHNRRISCKLFWKT